MDATITALDVGSYKPAHGHWERFRERDDVDPARHVHVAASLFHDLAPAEQLEIPAVWINRLGEESPFPRAAELADLNGLADALDGDHLPVAESMSHLRRASAPTAARSPRSPSAASTSATRAAREFRAGLVRVPRAWGKGGEEMVAAASLPLPYPEAAVVEEDTLGAQTLAIALRPARRCRSSSAAAAARTSARSRGSRRASTGSRSSGSTRTAT